MIRPHPHVIVLVALVMLAASAAPALAQGQASATAKTYPEPARLHTMVNGLVKRADIMGHRLEAQYNRTRDGNLGYALYILNAANRYAAVNYSYYAEEHLASFYPSAAFSNLSEQNQARNLTGNASVSFVLARTDAAYKGNLDRFHALIQGLSSAQANATVQNLPYLLLAAEVTAVAGNELNQYSTFRAGLQQRGAWNGTLVQGVVSYGLGPGLELDLAHRALLQAGNVTGGTPLDTSRFAVLVSTLHADESNYTARSGLRWFPQVASSYQGPDNAIFLAGLYAEENGTTAYNRVNDAVQQNKVTLDSLAQSLNRSTADLVARLDASRQAGIDHPYPAMVTNAALLLTYTYDKSSASSSTSFQAVIPLMFGHEVASRSLLDAYQVLTNGTTAASTNTSATPGGHGSALPGFAAGAAVLAGLVAVGAVVLLRRRS